MCLAPPLPRRLNEPLVWLREPILPSPCLTITKPVFVMTKAKLWTGVFMIGLNTKFILAAILTTTVSTRALSSSTTDFEKKCQGIINEKSKANESARFKKMIDLHWNYLMITYPEFATYAGFKGQNDRWTDLSLEAIATTKREALCALKMAESFASAKLKASDRVNLLLFKDQIERDVKSRKFPEEFLVIDQMKGLQIQVTEIFGVMPTATESDYKNILARLKGVAKVIDQNIVLLKEGLKVQVTPPKITLRDIPDQISKLVPEAPLESPLLKKFTEFPSSFPKEKSAALKADAMKIYSETLRPKFLELRSFLTEIYIPGARESIGWKDLPNGEAWYADRLRRRTTTNMSAKQIHDLGLSEVTRILKEIDGVMKEVKFKGSFADFQKKVRTDKTFYYTNADDLIRDYNAIAKRADPELVKLFGKLPRLPYGIAPVPAYQEKSSAAAYYNSGNLQAGRPGMFYVNTYDLSARPKWGMEALTFHEAVPGHHLQIAIAQEMENVPEFRKYSGYTAYQEGWGLYAESLGYEMGFYKDPYARFGQLSFELWRAVRLVVDTGLHAFGWTRDQAIDYFRKNSAQLDTDIIAEVDRYIVWAGQATAYKIGQLKIKELREKTKTKLGDEFDIRKFHDLVLGSGALPLHVLESMVNEQLRPLEKKIR